MYKVLQKYTRKHKHEQHGSGSGKDGSGPPRDGSYSYSRSRSEGAVNGAPPPGANGYYSQHQSSQQQVHRNGGVHHSGSQQQLKRSQHTEEAAFHERSRSRGGGEYRNGYGSHHSGSVPPPGAVTERQHFYDAATGAHGFQENTSWETKEHFERKVQKGQKRSGSQMLGAARDGSRARLDQWSSSGLAIDRVSELGQGLGLLVILRQFW